MLNKTKKRYRAEIASKAVIELSDEYHKSRKYLVLFSGLLFGLMFAGFRVNRPPQNAIEKVIPYTDIQISFDSPDVIQYLLVFLVVYFYYRLFIQWKLTGIASRSNKWAQIDFEITQSIAIISILSFCLQKYTNYKLVDIFETPFLLSFCGALISGELVGLMYKIAAIEAAQKNGGKIPKWIYLCYNCFLLVIFGLTVYFVMHTRYPLISALMVIVYIVFSFHLFYTDKIDSIFSQIIHSIRRSLSNYSEAK